MPLFAPADIAQLQGVAALAFHDDYRVLRKPDTATKDAMGNRTNATPADLDVIEEGTGRLRKEGVQPFEGIRADRLGSTVSLSFDLPLDTLTTAADVLETQDRRFTVTGVTREGVLGMVATARIEERT